MTPSSRAQFLIKELGIEKAKEHCIWVIKSCVKPQTIQYWREVLDLLK